MSNPPWMKSRASLSDISADIDCALFQAFQRAKSRHEKDHVKTLATKVFLDDVKGVLAPKLKNGWDVIVAAAYIDTKPRVKYVDLAGNSKEIEIGDLLFVKTIHALHKKPSGGRAWLVQAKTTDGDPPSPPPIINYGWCQDQLYFAQYWPDFSISWKQNKKSMVEHFSVSVSKPSLEWWAASWKIGTTTSSPSTQLPWGGKAWISCAVDPKKKSAYRSFGTAIGSFLADDYAVGRNYKDVGWPLKKNDKRHGWDELIATLLAVSWDKEVVIGHKAVNQNQKMPRVAVSSFFSTMPPVARNTLISAIAVSPTTYRHTISCQDQHWPLSLFLHSRDTGIMWDEPPFENEQSGGDEEGGGFLVVQINFVQLAQDESSLRPKAE